MTPSGAGMLCVGGGSLGHFRLQPPLMADASGNTEKVIDWNSQPVDFGPGRISPESTWHFQYWYRDPAFGFNLSDGLSVTFCP